MSQFTHAGLGRYPAEVPQPRREDGPWGEAIQHWLNERKWSQADLAKATKIQPKTISQIARGFHTQTRVLEVIAKALDVTLDRVLVSPVRWGPTENRKLLVRNLFVQAIRLIETGEDGLDERVVQDAKRIQALPRDMRATLRAMIANSEKLTRKQRHGTRGRSPVQKTKVQALRKQKP